MLVIMNQWLDNGRDDDCDSNDYGDDDVDNDNDDEWGENNNYNEMLG